MALTRNFLKSMGLTDEQVSAIIEGHTDTVTALTKERDDARASAAKVEELTRERDDYKTKYEKAGDASKVQAEFDAYKQKVEGEKVSAAKTAAIRKSFKAAGVNRDEFADLLLGKVDMDKVELDGDKVKDEAALLDPLKSKYAGCFGKVDEQGTPPSAPPSGSSGTKYTQEQIQAMSTEEINKNWDAIRASLHDMK